MVKIINSRLHAKTTSLRVLKSAIEQTRKINSVAPIHVTLFSQEWMTSKRTDAMMNAVSSAVMEFSILMKNAMLMKSIVYLDVK